MIKRWVRRVLPEPVLGAYHYALAVFAALFYGRPSERMVVIGVTGTSGKSTTCYLLARALEGCGVKVGLASTFLFKVNDREWLNDKKMTMVGRFQLQRLLRDMVKAGCTHAIVETTSEGIKQHRHVGVHYDVAVLTNLYPEHIRAHGSFENYKNEKLKLFAKLSSDPHKVMNGKRIEKVIVVNAEDPHAQDFLAFEVARKINVLPSQETISLTIPGEHNEQNALLALHIGMELGFVRGELERALCAVPSLPGRLERIDEGQPFTVIVDYAFEPRAMEKLYAYVATLPHERVIHVLGSTGGGRDTDRRAILGRFVREHADVLVITNEDPYDEDVRAIMEEVAMGARSAEGSANKPLEMVEDRKEAIRLALSLARTGDVVLVTGKGCEQAMVLAHGKKIPWDDRAVVRDWLHEQGYGNAVSSSS